MSGDAARRIFAYWPDKTTSYAGLGNKKSLVCLSTSQGNQYAECSDNRPFLFYYYDQNPSGVYFLVQI